MSSDCVFFTQLCERVAQFPGSDGTRGVFELMSSCVQEIDSCKLKAKGDSSRIKRYQSNGSNTEGSDPQGDGDATNF